MQKEHFASIAGAKQDNKGLLASVIVRKSAQSHLKNELGSFLAPDWCTI